MRAKRVVGGIVAVVIVVVGAVFAVAAFGSPGRDWASGIFGRPGSGAAGSAGQSPGAPGASGASASPGGNLGSGGSPDGAFGDLNAYLGTRRGTVTAAVEDLRTGRTWTIGDTRPQAEASVVKVDILEKLLAGSPGGLSSNGQELARKMITVSDNDSATTLWNAAGGAAAIGAFNAKAGLSHTKLSSCVTCPGFTWPGWGLSQTTPADQLALLRSLAVPGSLLSAAARSYALSLLEHVDPAQRWGVTGGVPASATVALKDGWLPLAPAAGKGAAGKGTGGRGTATGQDATDWQVNSVGWVSGGGRDYLIAVLSTGNPTLPYGEATINGLSSRVWTALGH